MFLKKIILSLLSVICLFEDVEGSTLLESFEQEGYVELYTHEQDATAYDALYVHFDAFIEFLQLNPFWTHQLYAAKERFIRSKEKNIYSTDVFGLYDESKKRGRNQISFYYSSHFNEFIGSHYPKVREIPEIARFFDACEAIQQPYGSVFQKAFLDLGLNTLEKDQPPILLKVIKYLPQYAVTKPHYDGSLLTLFLDSTDNEALLISPYRLSYSTGDFTTPKREFSREELPHSVLLIPGALLIEHSIYPTPHLVVESGKKRYATIAFCMKPHHSPKKYEVSPLPDLNPSVHRGVVRK